MTELGDLTDSDSSPTQPAEATGARRSPRGFAGLGVAAAIVIVLAGAYAASGLVSQTLLGLMLAVAVLPVLRAARRWGLPTPMGAALASLCLLVVGSLFGVLLTFAATQLGRILPRFRAALGRALVDLHAWFEAHDIDRLSTVLDDGLDVSRFEVLPRLLDAAASIGSLGYVLLVAMFALFEAPTFEAKWRRVTSTEPTAQGEAAKVLFDVQRYLLVKTGICAGTGILVGLWTALLGLEAATLWGFFAYALNYIPFLGSFIAGVPPTVVALVTVDFVTGFGVAVGVLVINVLMGNVLEPRVMGRAMGLSPLFVLLSVALWGWVLGPIGALLSVPLTVIVKLILERSDRYAWVAVLLGSPAEVEE